MLNFFFFGLNIIFPPSYALPCISKTGNQCFSSKVSLSFHFKFTSVRQSDIWEAEEKWSHFCPDCTRQTESLCPILPAVSQEILQFISVLQVADVIVRILCGFVLSEFLNFKKCFPLFLFFQPFRQFYWFLFPCS